MKESLREALSHRILLLDGATGSVLMHGNNDELCLTAPERVSQLHRQYLEAGADIVSTNTFCSQRISQVEYHFDQQIAELNHAGARLAIAEAERMTALTPERPRYVLGDVGPTNKMLSMSDEAGEASISFDQLEAIYIEQIQALLEEGVDGILVETIFDTLNAKAAISAYEKAKAEVLRQRKESSKVLPEPEILLSMTISDASGRTLSGQTVTAFLTSILHARPLAVGLNCGLGADGMVPYLREVAAVAPCYVSCHPNAGLPNQFGKYDDTPEDMHRKMQVFLDESLANIIGGCCGTTPAHIAEMRRMIDLSASSVRQPKPQPDTLLLSGLESYSFSRKDFVRVGERCNVAGSRKFLRLINEKKYDEALDIARKQIADGAMAIDVNMDDGLLDAPTEMRTFLRLMMNDPEICRIPVMVDSSRFAVIEEGLKCCQGKCIVNSISLKMGEAEFIENARTVKRLGAAVIVMCFDEEGQATDYARRIAICQRAYHLLVDEVGFNPCDIIFDPNVLTIATGMDEHADYANDFIRATRWITEHLPGTRVSGGLSNLSFAFRGNNYIREAMHAVFLHHAIANGMGMAIMNPATAMDYFSIPAELSLAITEVLLNLYPEASERLIQLAAAPPTNSAPTAPPTGNTSPTNPTVPTTPEARLTAALIKGGSTTLEADIMELIHRGDTPLQIISGPLMDGMNQVGERFGAGKMFLPQVVKTARTMKKAVSILNPYMAQDAADTAVSSKAGKILIATVKGDVHDIGKNIVAVILSCNNFEVIDLGVMVPKERIIETAIKENVDIVCLSGLITPSLEEMCHVAEGMEEAGLRIPIMVGGATTSPLHTAMKIAPLYHGGVFHMRDAATNPVFAIRLLDPALHEAALAENLAEQQRLRNEQQQKAEQHKKQMEVVGVQDTLARRFQCDWSNYQPATPPFIGRQTHHTIPLRSLLPLINWKMFYLPWRVKEGTEEAQKIQADATVLLQQMLENPAYDMRTMQAFFPAQGGDDHIKITYHSDESGCPCCSSALPHIDEDIIIPTPRQNLPQGTCLSLCDYISPLGNDHIGLFAATVSQAFIDRLETIKREQGNTDYDALLLQTLGDRLVEAASEWLHRQLGWSGIRPAIGYSCLPDQKTIFLLDKILNFQTIGITLTENGAMYPQASVCGLYIGHPQAVYFPT